MSEELNFQEQNVKAKKPKLTKIEKWFRTMRRFHAVFMRPFFPYKKLGHTEKFNDRAYIIVGNHKSVLDVVPAAICTDRPVHYMAKKELTEKKLGRWFTKKCECIIVSRDGSDARALMQAMRYLKNGESVCVFPEGTRNKTDEIFLPFKSGAAALAIKTKTPIVLMIQYTKIKAFKKSYFFYNEPFEFTEYYDKKLTEENIKEADEKLKARMLEIYNDLGARIENKKKNKKNKNK